MPELPINVASVTLSGRYIRPDGSPLSGSLTFEPPAHLTFPDADIISAGAATVELDATGAFTVNLIATDAAGGDPSSWTYTVVERLRNTSGRTFHLNLPSASPVVDLADIAPTNPALGDYVVVQGPPGPAGPPGPEGPQGPPGEVTEAELANAVAGLASLTGATFTGVVTVSGANFAVMGTNKGYRFRPLGSRLDLEATGSDLMVNVFSGPAFDGTQRSYLRLEAGVQLAHAIGKWQFSATADSAAVHVLDGAANQLGFHGATPVAKQTVTGSRASGAALADLLTKLATLGLITDGTTA